MKVFASNNRGFTLVELFIVIALIGIMTSIAFPTLVSQLPKIRLKNAVREVAQQMQLTRLKAVSTNKEHRIVFTNNTYPTKDSYRVERNESGNWTTLTIVTPETTLPIDANIYSISFSSGICEFNPNGTSSSGSLDFKMGGSTERKYRISTTSSIGKITLAETT